MNDPAITQTWLEAMAVHGARQTAARRAICEVLASAARAMEPLELFTESRKRCAGLGLVTVYRTLEILEELGLVARVHQPGGCNRYIRAAEGHQHLMICSACGKAEYFEGDDLSRLFQQVAGRSDFLVQDHWLQLFGLCRACQSASTS